MRRTVSVIALSVIVAATACAQAETPRPQVLDVPPDAEQYYYAIEVNGTLAGYGHVVAYPTELDGRPITMMRQKTFMLLNLLGSEFNSEIDQEYHVDPDTGLSIYSRAEARQGPSTFEWSARREGNVAHMHSSIGGGDATVELPDDVVFPNPLRFPHLKRDFVDGGAEQVTYDLLEVRESAVQKVVYTRLGQETLTLRGEPRDAIVLEEDHPELGLKLKVWIDRQSAMILQVELPNNRRVYLAEPRVVRSIEVANLDENIASRVGVLIADFQGISYMKVRAVFQPTGLRITPDMLTVPGQSFEGTVVDNRVDGVFEIRHPRYDGAGAPPFPPDFGDDEALRPHLRPSMGIESDDPVLIEHARAITAGAADSWEAATRISTWVARNIQYAIPGGGSARRTFDQRAGECGSHSVLVAALNRAVGIPARLVWGCQYIPSYGGAFGQHGWNEVYMGDEVGWVPLDSTSFEPDYVDSGHIRIADTLSTASALNPVEAEILEYRLGDGELVVVSAERRAPAAPPTAVPDRYAPYVGSYRGPRDTPFTIKVENDALVIDVGGRVALPMLDPDAEGVWRCKVTPDLYATFDRDGDGAATTLWIHEIARMNKIGDADEVGSDVPEALRGHLGRYLLAAVNQEFTALWRDGTIAIRQGDNSEVSPLDRDPGAPGTWVSRATGNRITFETDADGAVAGLTLDAASRVVRR